MRVEDRDRRAEELQNQMTSVVEESSDDGLPFEIPGVDSSEVVEEPVEEEPVEEVKEEKKSKDKQATLFNF